MQVDRHQQREPVGHIAAFDVRAEIQQRDHRGEHRQHDQRDFDEVEEEAEDEDRHHQHDQNAPGPEAQRLDAVNDQVLTA